MKKILGALLAMTSAAAAGPTLEVGTGPTYDRVNGDIVFSAGTVPVPKMSTGIDYEDGVITVTGGSAADAISISSTSVAQITVRRNSFSETFTTANLRKVVVYGNAGDDTFTNSTSIGVEVYGGDGNDSLTGGSGKDFLVGGLGDDTIRGMGGDDVVWGSGGHDYVYGGENDDIVKGHGGNDHLYGEAGEDSIYGGSGDDYISGGSSADTLVSIGWGTDTIYGGSSNDFFWVDTTDSLGDVTTTETTSHFVNKVSAFYSYTYDGGASSTAVAKDLTSFSLLDPVADVSNVHLENFADRPLFRESGPHKEDVLQGAAGDCFILGPLSAVANATPDSIRKLVVDLDDGTYAVRFYRDDSTVKNFVRVDADLYVSDSSGALTYAKLGRDGEALWVPIVEKAFAWFRRSNGNYAAIDGGSGMGAGSASMGADRETFYKITDTYDAQDLITWDSNDRPAGALANYINTTVPQLLNWIQDRQEEGWPVYAGNWPGADDSMTFTEDHWRSGAHIIMVDHVDFDTNGNPISLTMRDQVGNRYRTLTDFAAIYFFFGGARLYKMQ